MGRARGQRTEDRGPALGPDPRDLRALTRNQKRYLSRRVCWLCEMPLHRDSCSSLPGRRCTAADRARRRQACLAQYRPRAAHG